MALYRTPELRGHLRRALDNGDKDEIRDVIAHLFFYAGWPTAECRATAAEIFDDE